MHTVRDMAIPYLPPEIIQNILVWLDLKTLSSLRYVNKLWLQLITSPEFAKAHLRNSKKNSGYRCIFTCSSSRGYSLKQLSIESLRNYSTLINLKYPNDIGLHRPKIRLVGSCNGLVCIVLDDKHVVLWNPCTGTYRKLPCLGEAEERLITTDYGFGYDESNDDYKVLVLRMFRDEEAFNIEERCVSAVNVCSLKRGSWEKIQDFKRWVDRYYVRKLASGRLHWFTNPWMDQNREPDLVSFDMGREEFGILEQPSYGDDRFRLGLHVLEECLCLLIGVRHPNTVELWIMKEYGVTESWTKTFTISLNHVRKGYKNHTNRHAVLPNGDILVCYMDETIAVYNPKGDSFKSCGINKLLDYLEPVVYFQSLVSPVDL